MGADGSITLDGTTLVSIWVGTVVVTGTFDTTGTVKFTSDEAGRYYYAVVADGAGEPVMDNS